MEIQSYLYFFSNEYCSTCFSLSTLYCTLKDFTQVSVSTLCQNSSPKTIFVPLTPPRLLHEKILKFYKMIFMVPNYKITSFYIPDSDNDL